MTREALAPERLRAIMDELGLSDRTLATLLGYASRNSVDQALSGKQSLPAGKAAWLMRYRAMRRRQKATHDDWLAKNPPP